MLHGKPRIQFPESKIEKTSELYLEQQLRFLNIVEYIFPVQRSSDKSKNIR